MLVLVKFKRQKTSIFLEVANKETLKNAVDTLRHILKTSDDQAIKIGALRNGDYVALEPSTWSNTVLTENTDYAFAYEKEDFEVHQPSDEDVMEPEG
ncbi:hypothetical protein SPOG_02306 [Schizosaccharomyces cryophilus OY26]|uniref:Uncharacterized protein n=1 Tax=Schizosaccharomyces cryophilus (strain OY26 / ATCC MYA-4695 / CBS 11777 / NBRC 106824 / NRRL Y48691) TaxID=653667 RepID=S9VY27_SCHCR|nr:uncharacterized protein SPOG_02306 [Schizosaccharomyces cryophilus OY26]EPY51129.1 hypothetical protein SPOG_02306 [Schizosaccharomyces cryophilus OY26]